MGSTGSQARLIQSSHPPAHYQPVLMKDLGKSQSQNQDISVVDLFSGSGIASSASSSPVGSGSSSDDSGGSGGSNHENGDEEQQFTDSVMDKHLCALSDDSLNFGGQANTCDIAKYMANLKKKHMESEQFEIELETTIQDDTTESSDSAQKTCDQLQSDDSGGSGGSGGSGSINCSPVILDSKVDKPSKKSERQRSKSEHKTGCTTPTNTNANKNSTLRSPSSTHLSSHSPDRSRSTGTSPVKIIKIRSPRNSIVDTSGRRLNVSRESLKDRSPDRREVSPRRASEGGILKRSSSPKPPPVPAHSSGLMSSSCSSTTSMSSMGILKRSQSPIFKSRSPDRNRLSPRDSFESRSPDRYHSLQPDSGSYCSSRAGSFDSRASEPNLDIPRSVLKNARAGSCSQQGSFESRSPDRSGRQRSLSAHSSMDKSRSPEPYDHYYQIYQQQMQQQCSPERKQRVSKSLERTGSKEYVDSGTYGRYGLSPERIYRIGPTPRSQSAENAFQKYGTYDIMRSNESLSKSIEHPTCVECLYQRKPS